MESWDSKMDGGYPNKEDTVQVTEINNNIQYSTLSFPVGYRFCPTDEELIVHYLCNKVSNRPLPCQKIKDVNLYDYNPEDLIASFGASGEKEWFFFTPRDRKYKNGTRPNRVAGDGYWKATGADKSINSNGKQVGVRKALVFYRGKPPNGDKSMWIMQEFRVSETLDKPRKRDTTSMRLDDWVLCRIYKKPSSNRIPTKDEHPKTTEYNEMPQTVAPGEYVDLINFPSETIIDPISPLKIEYSSLNSWNSNQGKLFNNHLDNNMSNSWNSNQGEVFNNHLDNNMSMGYGMYDQFAESNPYFSDEINNMTSNYFPNPLNMSMNEDDLYIPEQEGYHLSSQFDAHERTICDQYNEAFKDEDEDGGTYMNQKLRKRFH